jgi:hypothetical protein
MSHLKTLLEGSIIIAELRKELAAKDALIDTLRRELGYRRLWNDLRRDFDLSADDMPALLKRQI